MCAISTLLQDGAQGIPQNIAIDQWWIGPCTDIPWCTSQAFVKHCLVYIIRPWYMYHVLYVSS